ncbi:hypothetical protein MRQ36_28245 [Micromonospora sp. R77]|uniref:hypothetical protein n=1 Tax=Micromonospora sp. R77 TaxID=2925836 RepID=UPI001F610711|nr:hypothetical protein [Micromonospora sp. R77]MCI4066230.1 hypothetical protein [Micromonospora sp. R77]
MAGVGRGQRRSAVTAARHEGTATETGLRLAAGWYIALRSDALASKPRALDLFGRRLVAWRDSHGSALIMQRHRVPRGASPTEHDVVDGLSRRRLRSYPVVERYGYVWAWYGGSEPAYELPRVPALDGDRSGYLTYRFSHTTPAPPRRILENAFDFYHFMFLHGVKSQVPMDMTLLSDQQAAAENGPPIPREAWFGAQLTARGLHIPQPFRAFGFRTERSDVLVDSWPTGQRLTFLLDGKVVAKELLGVTPVAADQTIMQGWTLVARTGRPLRDVLTYLGYRAQHRQGTREDLVIYRHASESGAVVPVKYDHGVLRFRKFHAGWAEHAARAETEAG